MNFQWFIGLGESFKRALFAHSAPGRWRVAQWAGATFLAAAFLVTAPRVAQAELQFDVFVGYDTLVREASWFPVACEIFNDGPTFDAVVLIETGSGAESQIQRMPIELPTNTRKRFVVPVFAGAGSLSDFSARLVTAGGKTVQEIQNIRPSDTVRRVVPLMGALSRAFSGMPSFPELKVRTDLQPRVARLQVEQFPDTPIALEGLDALYLNSEKALDMKVGQVEALLYWLHSGGHLILAVEQMGDVNGTPWLRSVVGTELDGVASVEQLQPIWDWLQSGNEFSEGELRPALSRSLSDSSSQRANPFEKLSSEAENALKPVPMAVVTGDFTSFTERLQSSGVPLILQAARGRGMLTLLTFSPEREPLSSWKLRPWFWARVARVPHDVLAPDNNNRMYGAWSVDGVFGAMIDSRQVRTLPVHWLLLLLVVYLVVIGPLDRYWLRKIRREMLTWITFPAYVVLFSVLIYFIGFMLRAGETEWNELHIVDVLPRGDQAELRGRTYASLYSPVNARYPLQSTQPFAALRGEFLGNFGGRNQQNASSDVKHRGDGFEAEVYVPVWINQLFVTDWYQPASKPLHVDVNREGSEYRFKVENRSGTRLGPVRVAIGDRIFELGEISPGDTLSTNFPVRSGMSIDHFVASASGQFHQVVQSRNNAFGNVQHSRLDDLPRHAAAISFLSERDSQNRSNHPYYQGGFIMPPAMDLTPLIQRGDAVVLAWAEDFTLTQPINQFPPRRSQRHTMLRVAVTPGGADTF